ncbi:MAG: DUF3857 domain-containing protein [Terracidiphilus sp.]|jgi:transglutaminase-like putative cysteine protease
MRVHVFVRHLSILLALASPALLLAQFQQPTDEELKMTTDPKAPGAAAVYLYREDSVDFSSLDRNLYERIKVLTESGKEQATIIIPYDRRLSKVDSIQGRTIHADGTIIPMTVKPSDLMDIKAKGYQENSIVFTLPSVEVGSILEYRLRIHIDSDSNPVEALPRPTVRIQMPLFTHQARLAVKKAPIIISYLQFNAPPLPQDQIKTDHEDNYILKLTDIPPLPKEEWMPPLYTLQEHIDTFWLSNKIKNQTASQDYWAYVTTLWAEDISWFVDSNKSLKDAVAQIVSPTDTDEQKARKIYAAVQKLDNTSFSRRKSEEERKKLKIKEIHSAQDVWKQKTGSADEIAMLYVALARLAGLKVWPMLAVDRNRALFDPNYLEFDQLDDYVAIVVLDGKEVFLDPGQKMCPFGLLHWKHTLAGGIRLADKDAHLFGSTPPDTYKQSVTQRTGDLQIDTEGNVKGAVTIAMSGMDALYWRQLTLQNDVEEIKKQFNDSIREQIPEGVTAEVDHLTALDDSSQNLIAVVNVSGSLAAATGKRLFLPGLFFQSRAAHPFVAQDKRITPVDMHYARAEQDDITYHLPPGYSVESAPQSTDLPWPNHAALKIRSRAKEASVEVARSLVRNFAVLDPKDYSDLHDFYQKVASADQQQIVLTSAPPANPAPAPAPIGN